MSGLAIKVPNVNWSKKNLGAVDFGSDTNDRPLDTVSDKAYAIYDDYITKSQRRDNQCLLLLIDDLVKAGLDQKCKGLFYLASKHQNMENIKYSVIGNNYLNCQSGEPNISNDGIESESSSIYNLYDNSFYYPNGADSNLCLVFMMSKASTSGFEWGAEETSDYPHAFSTAGNEQHLSGIIFKWCFKENVIKKEEDDQSTDGVYVIHINRNSLVYKHKVRTISKRFNMQSTHTFRPRLMAYQTLNNHSTGAMKMYATFSREDLTASDINKIHEIFTKYEHLL